MTPLSSLKSINQGRVGTGMLLKPATRPLRKSNSDKTLWRVGTGRDGILHYSPLRARDQVKLLTRPFLSLPSLKRPTPDEAGRGQ